ncbi:uncharacterized protein LTR77_003751 [Saxophila tyrrhenica]|uniref:Uncharacterized protein n=1 Tax=Saxophila tyrrhenica TaxID=1690608 RepID=A0AAV9PEP0_9PEZI|nr:hypothetical protein LTR77_003751 [Saxophila tyrrhenica]
MFTIGNDSFVLTKKAVHDEIAEVWAMLDEEGTIVYKVRPQQWREPASAGELELTPDEYVDMDALLEELRARKESAVMLQAAEEVNTPDKQISKLEAELQKGREVYEQLCSAYGQWKFKKPELVSIAAECLRVNLRSLQHQPSTSSEWWDVFIWLLHDQLLVSWRDPDQLPANEIPPEIPHLPSQLTFTLTEAALSKKAQEHWINKNVVSTMASLVSLSMLRPIASGVFPGLIGPYVNKKFRQGMQFFYWNMNRTPDYTSSHIFPDITPDVKFEGEERQKAIAEAAQDLKADGVTWLLVRMVWHDYLMPAAKEGDAREINAIMLHLQGAVQGEDLREDGDYGEECDVEDEEWDTDDDRDGDGWDDEED